MTMQRLANEMPTEKTPVLCREDALRVEMIDVNGMQLRSAMRPGSDARPPLILLNGIGAKLEALNGFIKVLNPEIGVIIFDVP